ncbi:MAG: DUF1329 domain-containing protein [Gammaproteobacteria bacterium]|nr:DUF1329 domain-containing protein [Gammaproteobacteria bacterium]
MGLRHLKLIASWRAWVTVVLGSCAAAVSAGDFDIDLAQIQELSPPPGSVISGEGLDKYRQVLDPDLADLIAQGWYTITVGEPLSFAPHANFIAATQQHGDKTQLGPNPSELLNYVDGRPFPGELTTDDPRAGEKLAWNMRYAYGGDSARIPEMYWDYRDMRSQSVERTLTFEAAGMRFMFRHVKEPMPNLEKNPYAVYSAITLTAQDPADVDGTKLLIYYNSDDNAEEQGWMYVPNLRRVRRVATTARTDSFLGSDIMIEDFLGYTGRLKDMEWSFHGATYVLLPMYRHDLLEHSTRKARNYDYHFVDFTGHSGCFPKVTWQLRKAYVLEGKPRRDDHPLSKRFFYVDAQTSMPILGKVYDRAGAIWKILIAGVAHPDYHLAENRGSGVPLLDSSAVIDLQNKHCTTLQMLSVTNPTDVKQSDFEPSSLNVGAR